MVAKHVKKGLIISIFLVVILFLVSCSKNNNELGGDIPLTDLASTYEGEATDAEGNLLAPFDVVYPEAFSSGEYKYDESVVLLKMKKDFNGQLSKNLENCGIEKIEKFMTGEDGDWYRATINSKTDAITVMKKARSLKEVLVVDLDYIYENAVEEEWESVGPTTDCTDLLNEKVKNNENAGQQWYLTHCDIQKAWKFLEDEGIEPGGLSSVTVAVIDTGVDYNHPDLKANMWVNSGEIAGNGVDDDGNGYVDDIHGVNVIANNGSGDMANVGNPMDDHGHGTHVAGIIAASNNKAGIVGIAYNAKIMAVKAGQATGVFLQSDIAEGILYAYQMGADVINMSFGGSACSIAVQDALTQAYTTATLVASAGNNSKPNEAADYYKMYPLFEANYPAALSYVIGVMSVGSQNYESLFSNWDVFGFNSLEYEVYAPGEDILSTLPNNRYGKLSGTSMSAPIVSGIAALLRSYFTDRDMYPSKFITAQLSATSQDTANCCNPDKHVIYGEIHNIPMIVNAYDAFTKMPKPSVNLLNYYLFDSEELSENNNGDGVIDAGEVINIGAVLRNRWGMSKDTIVSIDSITSDFAGVENSYIEIITGSVDFGGVGTYSTKDLLIRDGSVIVGCETPLVIKIKENCPNDYRIKLNVSITCKNALDVKDNTLYTTVSEIYFDVRNGCILPSQITEDMTLTKDNFYIIPNATYIHDGVTVTVEEGTQIQFWGDDPLDPYADTYIAYLNVAGKFITKGTEEEPVKLFPSELMSEYIVEINIEMYGSVELEYTTITNPKVDITTADHCTFNQNFDGVLNYRVLRNGNVYDYSFVEDYMISYGRITNSLIYRLSGANEEFHPNIIAGFYDTCSFVDCALELGGIFQNCVFAGNNAPNFEGSKIINSGFYLGANYFSFGEPFYWEENGSTYVEMYSSIREFELIDEFLDIVGGHFAYIETRDEYTLIMDKFIDYNNSLIIGLDVSTMTWGNGVKFTLEDLIVGEPKGDVAILTNYFSGGYLEGISIVEATSAPFLIEIPGEIYCQDIILKENNVSIDSETQYQIEVTTLPEKVDSSKFIYISSDSTVANVNGRGLVTPLREGEVTIYVYSPDFNVVEECNIVVTKKIPLEKIDINHSEIELNCGDSLQLKIKLYPSNTTEKYVSYASSNSDVASIDGNGLITAYQCGQTEVTVEMNDVISSVLVTVINSTESISFSDKFYITYIGDTSCDWYPTVLPENSTNKTIIWSSSNPEIAYVDENNQLIRVSKGNATIRASIEGTNLFDEIVVCVSDDQIDSTTNVIQMSEYHGNITAVLEDNTLWYWGENSILPVKLLDNVKSAQICGTSFQWVGSVEYFTIDFILVNSSGNLLKYSFYFTDSEQGFVIEDLKLSNVRKVYYYDGVTIAIKEDGTGWSYGTNDFGQLGDGTTINREKPVQMLVRDIVDVTMSTYLTLVLDAYGNVYYFGGYDCQIDGGVYLRNAKTIVKYDYGIAIQLQDNSWVMTNLENYISEVNCDDIYGCSWVSKNGIMINYHNSSFDCSDINNINKVFALNNELAYILTDDFKLYGIGSNDKNQMANLDNNKQFKPTRIFFGINNEGAALELEESNIEDGILYSSMLKLNFNQALTKSIQFTSIILTDSNDNQISIFKNIVLDELCIDILGLQNGETYTLTIPNSAFSNSVGISNDEMIYTFTYQDDTEIKLNEIKEYTVDYDGDHLFKVELEYSIALEGPNFDLIAIKQDGVLIENVNIELLNNVLSISSELPYGEYVVVIPEGSLVDNLGRYNEEMSAKLIFANPVEILEGSISDGQLGVSNTEDIVFEITGVHSINDLELITLVDENGEIINIKPSFEDEFLTISHEELIAGMTYVLNIPQGTFKGAFNLNDEVSIMFTTYETVNIIQSSISDSNVALSPVFKLYLNGEATIDSSKIKLTCRNENIEVNVSMKGLIVEVTPLSTLLANSEYSLTVLEGAFVDKCGAVNNQYEKNFTTINVEERYFWSRADIIKIYEPFKYYNAAFYNNALLNNLNDTDVNHWLRVEANSNSSHKEIGAAGNYWGTVNETIINKQIFDFDDYQSLNDINIGNYLTIAPSNTFPFVTQITLYNAEGDEVTVVSNETVRFIVEFNRDMDVTVPLRVRFGSAKPYADYEISGQYLDARTWEGVYTLKTTIENGNQFFNISNGRAADDHYLGLYETQGRFTFEIDTFAAQAMIMQANPTEEGVHLTWMQDDFETLAGYNVYRSEAEDGYYQRLNSYVLSPDTKEFLDINVEPGKIYYYNFTVVQTDLTESTPSGKVSVYSLDTMAPNIYHSPVYTGYTNSNLLINATITDNLQITNAYLYYRVIGTTEWKRVMMNGLNSRYTAVILSDYVTTEGLEYYIKAYDGVSYTYKGNEENPYIVEVRVAVDRNSMGDVDGDGAITIKDALMVLQAANDQLNLTEEQFKRADLNEDGILSAAEALRILQYVSGKITSILE